MGNTIHIAQSSRLNKPITSEINKSYQQTSDCQAINDTEKR